MTSLDQQSNTVPGQVTDDITDHVTGDVTDNLTNGDSEEILPKPNDVPQCYYCQKQFMTKYVSC